MNIRIAALLSLALSLVACAPEDDSPWMTVERIHDARGRGLVAYVAWKDEPTAQRFARASKAVTASMLAETTDTSRTTSFRVRREDGSTWEVRVVDLDHPPAVGESVGILVPREPELHVGDRIVVDRETSYAAE